MLKWLIVWKALYTSGLQSRTLHHQGHHHEPFLKLGFKFNIDRPISPVAEMPLCLISEGGCVCTLLGPSTPGRAHDLRNCANSHRRVPQRARGSEMRLVQSDEAAVQLHGNGGGAQVSKINCKFRDWHHLLALRCHLHRISKITKNIFWFRTSWSINWDRFQPKKKKRVNFEILSNNS